LINQKVTDQSAESCEFGTSKYPDKNVHTILVLFQGRFPNNKLHLALKKDSPSIRGNSPNIERGEATKELLESILSRSAKHKRNIKIPTFKIHYGRISSRLPKQNFLHNIFFKKSHLKNVKFYFQNKALILQFKQAILKKSDAKYSICSSFFFLFLRCSTDIFVFF